jgi:hypothetical protein
VALKGQVMALEARLAASEVRGVPELCSINHLISIKSFILIYFKEEIKNYKV